MRRKEDVVSQLEEEGERKKKRRRRKGESRSQEKEPRDEDDNASGPSSLSFFTKDPDQSTMIY
jgi:hypothetical protein